MRRSPSEEYLQKAKSLPKEHAELLLMRTRAHLVVKHDEHEPANLEDLAILLEIEEEHLNEWRKRFAEAKARLEH